MFEGCGDHRDLHRVDRRQRQMCIRDRAGPRRRERDARVKLRCSTTARKERSCLRSKLISFMTWRFYPRREGKSKYNFYKTACPKSPKMIDRRRTAERRTPVSYTHLRAHETVLELVCRLLPEKKKQAVRNHLSETYAHYDMLIDAT